jgi:hypothetical protein
MLPFTGDDLHGVNWQAANTMTRVVVRCNGELAGARVETPARESRFGLALVADCVPDFLLQVCRDLLHVVRVLSVFANLFHDFFLGFTPHSPVTRNPDVSAGVSLSHNVLLCGFGSYQREVGKPRDV